MTACINCNSANNCLACSNSHYLNFTTNLCELCSISILYCTQCTSSSNCIACSNSKTAIGNICSNCETNCITCDESSSFPFPCTLCQIGYIIGPTHACVSCGSNCLDCNNGSVCLVCDQGFFQLINASGSILKITC
jgi:hypothetical protein